MAKTRFVFNMRGLNELMKSTEMQKVLNDAADQMAALAGNGYEVERAHRINFVAIASVRTATQEALLDNSENNTLEKAKASVKI